MESLKEAQNDFIQKEIWMLTFSAAFQRANVYKADAAAEQKKHFKNKTTGYIDNVILNNYKNGNVNDEQHIENIKNISNYSAHFSELFNNGRINFGIAQKILNLYLKYQWSLGNIPAPPHFPVDRIIQGELNKHARLSGLNALALEPWTQYPDEKHYLAVIDMARQVINKSFTKYSLAELELELFNRR